MFWDRIMSYPPLERFLSYFTRERSITLVVFLVLLVSLYFGVNWTFGLLFMYWLVPAVLTGQTLLVFPIARENDPFLFWGVSLLWAILGLVTIIIDPMVAKTFGYYDQLMVWYMESMQ